MPTFSAWWPLGVAAVFVPVLPASATIRIGTYNIDVSDTGSVVSPPETYRIIEAMGEMHLLGNAQPLDVLTLTELDSVPSQTLSAMVNALNAVYGAGTYAYDPYVGKVSSIGQANGPSGVIYNTKTVQDIAAVGGFTRVSGTYAPRESIRYQFRPVGYGSDADFYVYVDHAKASANTSGTTDNETRRLYEAQDVRANADALGPNAHIVYTGDYNLHYASAEFSYQYMVGQAGSGKMIDVVNPANNFTNTSTYQGIETESAQSMFGRYDLVLPTQAAINQPGLQYVPGTSTVFGNNGTTARGKATNLSTNTALAEFGPTRQQSLLNDLYTASDHLPAMADFNLNGVTPQWLAWTGGTGNWSTAKAWHAGVVPNSASTEARIDNGNTSGASAVTLDQNATVKDLVLNAGDSLTLAAGRTLTIAGPATSTIAGTIGGAGALVASGPVVLGASAGVGTLAVSGSARVGFSAGASGETLSANSLSIDPAANVDLGANALDVAYGATSPVATIRSYLFDGRLSSSTAGADPQGRLAVGYLDTGTDVVARATYYGDANLDGVVDADDFALIDRGFRTGGTVWSTGDFNYDARVDQADYLLIDRVFVEQTGTLSPELLADREAMFGTGYAAELVAAVPEPGTALGVAAVLPLIVARRRRR